MAVRGVTFNDNQGRLLWLEALEAAGLDNWDGCEFAHEILLEWLEEQTIDVERFYDG